MKPMKKKKIAVIGTRGIPATYGGIEKHCEDLYSLLSKMDYEITVYGRKYYLPNELKEYKSVKIKKIPVLNIKGLEAFIHSFISTILACFSDADILHFHAQGPSIFTWIPRILAPQKKIVFTCHGIDWQRDKWNMMGKTVIQLGELASAVFPHKKICVSEALSEYYFKKYKTNTEKIVNGVDIKQKIDPGDCCEKFNLEKSNYIIFVGRMVPEKAPDILIKAFKSVSTENKLVIIGGNAGVDDYFSSIKELAKDDKRIIFTDYLYQKDLQELYSNALAYISASKLEGLPITVLEAMSYALPIVLSDIPPHTEILKLNPASGISFKTNDVKNCENAIEKILNTTTEKIENMGQNSINTVKDYFSWDKVANLTDETYQKL